MEFEDKEQQLTSPELIFFLNNSGLNLPESYKNHILDHNGGSPTFPFFKTKKIHYFHSIKHGEFETLETILDSLKDVLPENFFPFAEDEGGNQFCISLENENNGKVYFCPMDMGEVIPEFLSDSFNEFMSALTEKNEY